MYKFSILNKLLNMNNLELSECSKHLSNEEIRIIKSEITFVFGAIKDTPGEIKNTFINWYNNKLPSDIKDRLKSQ